MRKVEIELERKAESAREWFSKIGPGWVLQRRELEPGKGTYHAWSLPQWTPGRIFDRGARYLAPKAVSGHRIVFQSTDHLFMASFEDYREAGSLRVPWSLRDDPAMLGFGADLFLILPRSDKAGPLRPPELWHASGQELKLRRTLPPPSASLSPDGRFLLTSGRDRRWCVQEARGEELVFEGHDEELRLQGSAWSPSERYLAFTLPRRMYVVDLERSRVVGFPDESGRVLFLSERRIAVIQADRCRIYDIVSER